MYRIYLCVCTLFLLGAASEPVKILFQCVTIVHNLQINRICFLLVKLNLTVV